MVECVRKPELIIIAGPNGSGKTSVTKRFLHHEWAEGTIYINPDEVANEMFGNPRCALRLSVVAVTGGVAFTHDIGVDIVRCLAVHGTYFVYEVYRFIGGMHRGNVADKFGFFLNERGFRSFVYRFVIQRGNSFHQEKIKADIKSACNFLLVHIETLFESVYTSACVNELLLTCVERMAL